MKESKKANHPELKTPPTPNRPSTTSSYILITIMPPSSDKAPATPIVFSESEENLKAYKLKNNYQEIVKVYKTLAKAVATAESFTGIYENYDRSIDKEIAKKIASLLSAVDTREKTSEGSDNLCSTATNLIGEMSFTEQTKLKANTLSELNDLQKSCDSGKKDKLIFSKLFNILDQIIQFHIQYLKEIFTLLKLDDKRLKDIEDSTLMRQIMVLAKNHSLLIREQETYKSVVKTENVPECGKKGVTKKLNDLQTELSQGETYYSEYLTKNLNTWINYFEPECKFLSAEMEDPLNPKSEHNLKYKI